MCLQDYKIGSRIYPVIREQAADAGGFVLVEPNPNRVGITMCTGSASTLWQLPTESGSFINLATCPTTGSVQLTFTMLMQWHGNITTGPFRANPGIGATARWIEYIAERELMAEIRGEL